MINKVKRKAAASYFTLTLIMGIGSELGKVKLTFRAAFICHFSSVSTQKVKSLLNREAS